MSERICQVDDFVRLTEETERLAKHVEDLRHRIAATNAKRRPSSGALPAQNGAVNSAPGEAPYGSLPERPPHGPLSERPPHGPLSERPPHGPLSERPPHGPLSERPPHGPLSERPCSSRTERPSGSMERPQGALSERSHGATERPRGSRAERPSGSMERPHHQATPVPERTSCLASVSRWLPPLSPARDAVDSDAHEGMSEAGRYCIISPRRERAPVRPKPPKSDVA
ncbi:uncharacterized protein SOCEGT47_048380 [Sorangium cellulosum]|uniref:Uncharacterized protein n=1 Tax=Sorangium cellulosum TaxID=56 RepID=A0A4P2Q525_SORCE|nr:hypothetical protein [Sorangium cellulosum]AUX24301.1 uncharacterized protein SOCEGT47_048380 [Sorangium cellulosum]